MRITTKDIKKEERRCMKSSPPRRIVQRQFFQIHPSVSGVNCSNNKLITQVKVNISETEHDTTFKIS